MFVANKLIQLTSLYILVVLPMVTSATHLPKVTLKKYHYVKALIDCVRTSFYQILQIVLIVIVGQTESNFHLPTFKVLVENFLCSINVPVPFGPFE